MPALSLAQLETALGIYTPTDGSFVPRLNQALSRIHNMGTYRDLTVQYSLPVVDGMIYLPKEADAVLHTIIDGFPAAVRSLWHDLKSVGTGSNDLSWGLVDAGFGPVLLDLAVATDTLYLVPATESVTRTAFAGGTGIDVVITASDGTSRYQVSASDAGTFVDPTFTFEEPILYIDTIRFEGLTDSFDIRTTSGDPDTTIATVGPGEGVTRYRRFRTPNVEDGKVVHVLCKRAFVPLVSAGDITYVGNLNAIKNGLLATVAEDANDVERAAVFWNTCFQLMEEEASSTRGAAQPRLTIDPHGCEGKMGIRGMM